MRVPGDVGGNGAYVQGKKDKYYSLNISKFASVIHNSSFGMRLRCLGAATDATFHRWRKPTIGCDMVTPGRRLARSTCARFTSTAVWSTRMKE